MKDVFQFKQFNVRQAGSVMRVNTDGVLLGALTQMSQVQHILDIGTGTGVIALMSAQRFPDAFIDAIDIDPVAVDCATQNFRESVFENRLQAHQVGVEDYQNVGQYQLIVSNPPFFVEDLKNPDPNKRRQRHTHVLFFKVLFERIVLWLDMPGRFYLIWPPHVRNQMLSYARQVGLHECHTIHIHSFADKAAFRMISVFSRVPEPVDNASFVIYDAPGRYTDAYKTLLQAFLLRL